MLFSQLHYFKIAQDIYYIKQSLSWAILTATLFWNSAGHLLQKPNPNASYFKLSYVFWEHNDSVGRGTTVLISEDYENSFQFIYFIGIELILNIIEIDYILNWHKCMYFILLRKRNILGCYLWYSLLWNPKSAGIDWPTIQRNLSSTWPVYQNVTLVCCFNHFNDCIDKIHVYLCMEKYASHEWWFISKNCFIPSSFFQCTFQFNCIFCGNR